MNGPDLSGVVDEYKALYAKVLNGVTAAHFTRDFDWKSSKYHKALVEWYAANVTAHLTAKVDLSRVPERFLAKLDGIFSFHLEESMANCGSQRYEWFSKFNCYRKGVLDDCAQPLNDPEAYIRLYVVLHGDLTYNTPPWPLFSGEVARALSAVLDECRSSIVEVRLGAYINHRAFYILTYLCIVLDMPSCGASLDRARMHAFSAAGVLCVLWCDRVRVSVVGELVALGRRCDR